MAERQKVPGSRCLVTGGGGFVGRRLAEMLLERGAAKVVSYDIRHAFKSEDDKLVLWDGDLCDAADVLKACEGVDIVYHVAALVGPYYKKEMYEQVNYHGTLHIIEACKKHGIQRLVMCSSPSTRFTGKDILNLSEMDLPQPKKFLEEYAKTKAMGDRACLEACSDELMTCAVAPHQVYGPRDALFLPSFLRAAKSGKLRVMGPGANLASFTHVDNISYAHILAGEMLYKGSPCLGQFYFITDVGARPIWSVIDSAVTACGMPSLFNKFKVPTAVLYAVAHVCVVLNAVFKLRLKLTPFVVTMMTINRVFNIDKAHKELGYNPLVEFEGGWEETVAWFKERPELWELEKK